MIQNQMPGEFAKPNVHEEDKGLKKLAASRKVALINDNTLCERIKQILCFPLRVCCCPLRFKVKSYAKGYEVGEEDLYTITESSCCCPLTYTMTDQKGEKVNIYTQKCCWFPACQFCLGGPGFDVNDFYGGQKGQHHGYAKVPPCQCCNLGYDVKDAEENKVFFVGHVCNCCKKSLYFEPVWNGDEDEVLNMNVYVTPCLKRYLPCCCCCMKDHWILDFPEQATGPQKSELVAGTLMKGVL